MKLRWFVLGLLVTMLLVPAVLLTFARAVEPAGGAWVRLVAFTPFATLLYAGSALLLVLAWLRGRGAWRVLARSGVVLALLGVVVHAVWASGPYVGPSPAVAAERSSSTLRVLTANLQLGEADTARVVELAVAQHVDVLALQEVTPAALARLRAAGLTRAFPHVAGRAADGPAGTMVFATRRLGAVERVPTGFGTWQVTVRGRGGPVHVLAVHARPPIGDASDWRADQQAVRAAARALDGPTVLAGDFNATMDHAPMRELVGRGYADAATQARSQWQPTWPAAGEVSRFGLGVPSLLPIDHVLSRQRMVALSTRTFTVAGTDHRALLAVLRR
jgi:endonuclease/exonuclease/phosphatase (EEP) superfamily protein YafD